MSAQSRFLYAHQLSKGVWYNGIGRVVCPHDVKDAGFEVSENHQQAYDDYVKRTIEAHRRQQENMTPAERDEQQFEISAAFEPGTEVVDIFTNKRWKA
jgi:hypothetical protein